MELIRLHCLGKKWRRSPSHHPKFQFEKEISMKSISKQKLFKKYFKKTAIWMMTGIYYPDTLQKKPIVDSELLEEIERTHKWLEKWENLIEIKNPKDFRQEIAFLVYRHMAKTGKVPKWKKIPKVKAFINYICEEAV